MLEWLHCHGVKWEAVLRYIYYYINIKRESERLMTERERERERERESERKVWRRECFFYMIINVSIIRRHRCAYGAENHTHSVLSRSFHPILSNPPRSPLSITIPCSRAARTILVLGDEKRMTKKKTKRKYREDAQRRWMWFALTRASLSSLSLLHFNWYVFITTLYCMLLKLDEG